MERQILGRGARLHLKTACVMFKEQEEQKKEKRGNIMKIEEIVDNF